jgi:hypothetical protein
LLVPDDESDRSNMRFMFMSHESTVEWSLLAVHFAIEKYVGALLPSYNVLFVVDHFIWFVKRLLRVHSEPLLLLNALLERQEFLPILVERPKKLHKHRGVERSSGIPNMP